MELLRNFPCVYVAKNIGNFKGPFPFSFPKKICWSPCVPKGLFKTQSNIYDEAFLQK